MDEVKKELDEIYRMISSIPVQGEAVELMAAARAKLRKAYASIEQMGKEVKNNG